MYIKCNYNDVAIVLQLYMPMHNALHNVGLHHRLTYSVTIDLYNFKERGSPALDQMKNVSCVGILILAILRAFNLGNFFLYFHDFDRPFQV